MPHPTTTPDPESRVLRGTLDVIALDEFRIAVRAVVVEGQRVIRRRGWGRGEMRRSGDIQRVVKL